MTYMFAGSSTDNPKLGAKVLSDGRESLFLDYYFGCEVSVDETTGRRIVKKNRHRESLGLYLWVRPCTPEKRQQNREALSLARRIRLDKEREMTERRLGYRSGREKVSDFLGYFQRYCEGYGLKDYKVMRLSLRRFRDFLADSPKYSGLVSHLRPELVTKDMMGDFTRYLQGRSKGYGAWSIYQRFKKVVNKAVEEGVFSRSPCAGVSIKVDDNILAKDVLSVEEMRLLIASDSGNANPEVRRAFIFCLYTGLRFCDVKGLTFENIDYSNGILKFEQNKTRGHSSGSGVVIPLNSSLLRLAGGPPAHDSGNWSGRIFDLPSYETCLRTLKRWVRDAGIDKKISWHCARHSFAVNILNNGANIKTVSSLLGHSSLRYTEKYTRAVDRLKADAINSLPDLDF